jgi:DNA-directed RNA polymerase subunit RPC12/RpoP
MTALHDTGELTCTRCGELLEGDFGKVGVSTSDEQTRTNIECPECGAPLQVVIESALPEALGVDIWIEDRREE